METYTEVMGGGVAGVGYSLNYSPVYSPQSEPGY